MKNLVSFTPCSLALNALIFELIDAADAFVERLSKKLSISGQRIFPVGGKMSRV